MKCKLFFCLACSKGSLLEEEIDQCGCIPQFKVQGIFTVPLKHRWWHLFLSLNWGYAFAFLGLITMNAVLISRLDLSFLQTVLESAGLGAAVPYLLKHG